MSAPMLEILYLRLEGPLQAWGETSRWVVRDTRLEPTKSGVVGLLGCCLGLGAAREHDRRLAQIGASLGMGVRVDRPGAVLRDYHTVHGGVLSAEGKIKITQSTGEAETVVSERDYLTDACFLVALAGNPALLDEIEGALRNPVWPPYLGRKSCAPSAPLLPALPGHTSRGIATNLRAALEAFPYLGRGEPPSRARAVIDADWATDMVGMPRQRRLDVPISFAARLFRSRYVYELNLELRGRD